MKPLNLFTINESGEVEKIVIPEYQQISYGSYCKRTNYVYYLTILKDGKEVRNRYDTNSDKLDRFCNWKLYSFNPSIEYATRIIIDTLQEQKVVGEVKLSRVVKALDKLVEGGNASGEKM